MARRRVTRKWETFAGRNRFWCGGRLMTAPQPGALLATLALVCGTSALHFAFDCPFLAVRVSRAVPAASGALFAVTLASLLRTALADPGVVPRAPPPSASAAAPARPPPRAREVLVRGTPVKLKYCFTCKMFRPPRASHCSLCDNCVERFDHHCPWVGNCVGRRNYRAFYLFVVSLAFLAAWELGCAAAHVALEARGAGLAAALRRSPASAAVAAACFLAVWSVLGLAGFHTYLAAAERTTNEDVKGAFAARARNPYSRGNACANCWHVLCGPLAPSLIDRRGIVLPDGHELPAAFRAVTIAPEPSEGAPIPPDPPYPGSPISPGAMTSPIAPLSPVIPPSPKSPHLVDPVLLQPQNLSLLHEAASVPLASLQRGRSDHSHNESLSASRLRLLAHTTMIDAALDLDEPEPPPHLSQLGPASQRA